MLLIITGNGKGKTTSALGTAIRAAGWSKKVAITFFDKGGTHYGEQSILDELKTKIDTHRFGLKRFDEVTRKFRFENTKKDQEEAKKGVKKVIELLAQDYFLIVCDEIINCLNLKLVEKKHLQELLDHCPQNSHLIFTGRNAPKWLQEKADLISEVNEIKHYFKQGKDAIKGLDY